MQPVSVVTGANSGLGRATAITLAGKGHRVFGTVRGRDKAAKLESMAKQAGVTVELIELDVTEDASVRDGFSQIIGLAGRVDNLVNNAGIGGNAVTEDCPISMYAETMNVNFYGAVRCIQAVLPGMRARRSGSIVNVSSVVGRVAAIAQQPYVTSKWALEGMSEGLAQEVSPFGIRVAIIEPGITKSAIFAKNTGHPEGSGAYASAYRRMFQFYAKGIGAATDPMEVGELVHHAITTDQPKLRYEVSWAGPEMIRGRMTMGDNAWIALGNHERDEDYYAAFAQAFGVDISPEA
jgi:NAD(P)-dependent dehydrogenase (short-subunit alcohol dehydrogenase family)